MLIEVIGIWEQGNYQPHHSECTFYINFVLIFKGIGYILTNLLIGLVFLKKLREQGNYQPHRSECTFYINFELIFKGIRYIFTNLLVALNF